MTVYTQFGYANVDTEKYKEELTGSPNPSPDKASTKEAKEEEKKESNTNQIEK